VVIVAGILGIGTNTALGTGTFAVYNSPTLSAATSSLLAPTNSVTLNGNLTFDDSFTTTPGAITWGTSGTNKWTIAGGERTITVNTAAGGYGVTINQPIVQDESGRGLVKMGNGTLTLNGANTYTGATTVLGGTLSIAKTFFPDWGGVLVGPGATLNLGFPASSPDTIAALFVDGAFRLNGTWGAIGSGAEFQSAQITGTGLLNVVPWEPPITTQPLLGDFNNDGTVDMGDYITWRKANGTNIALLNDNGLGAPVRLEHFTLWQQHFGSTPGSGTNGGGLGSGTIPEPNSILLILLALAGMSSTFRHRHR
jgi:autotransporter-associated beta strand protein